MDTTQINTVEWFFGYGGNHLGLKRVIPNLRLVAVCEREGYACANVVSKMEKGLLDPAPIWTDAKTFPSRQFYGLVDLFIASYPCQGFSCAGKRAGDRDPRFLWPWAFRFVVDARPSVVFFENVEGHVSLGLSTVISDLEEAGYAVEAGIFSASECGANHQRKRVFILGYDLRVGGSSRGSECPGWFRQCASEFSGALANAASERSGETRGLHAESAERITGSGEALADAECSEWRPPTSDTVESNGEEIGWDQGTSGSGECGEDVADATGIGEREPHDEERPEPRKNARENSGGRSDELGDAISTGLEGRSGEPGDDGTQQPAAQRTSLFWPSAPARPGEPHHEWEPPRVIKTVGGLGGGSNGRAANVDRLRLLGNGVYPACAAKAFVTLAAKLTRPA